MSSDAEPESLLPEASMADEMEVDVAGDQVVVDEAAVDEAVEMEVVVEVVKEEGEEVEVQADSAESCAESRWKTLKL